MVHFRIHFSYPLLLLVFLFGAVMTALLYFRLSKKYRKNRNRITSIVLHLIVLALAALTLAGTMFTYEIPNKENQIILLVDVSDTTEQSASTNSLFDLTVILRSPTYLSLKFPDAATASPDFRLNFPSSAKPITEKLKIIAIARKTAKNLFAVFVMIITSNLFS